MEIRDMLRKLCAGHSCHNCKVKDYKIDCVAIDKGEGSSDDCFAVEQLFYSEFPEYRPLEIPEDDFMGVFK